MFYSWQSDSLESTNKRRIRSALQHAGSILEDEFEHDHLSVVIDEATRDLPGSPNIPQAITRKIRNADVFVADITTINGSAPDGHRRVANPNVMFELGYAVAILGWSRVILLFNEAHGAFPMDVAFDIDRHRASPYRVDPAESRAQRKQAKPLQALLVSALRAIVVADPSRGGEEGELTLEQQRRLHDINVLREIFSAVHLPTLDQQIEEGPLRLPYAALQFQATVDATVSSTLFHVYDPELRKRILRFHKVWSDSLSHGTRYEFDRSATWFVFIKGRAGLTREQEVDWKQIGRELRSLRRALDALVQYVRDGYPEIDLSALNVAAWENYHRFESAPGGAE